MGQPRKKAGGPALGRVHKERRSGDCVNFTLPRSLPRTSEQIMGGLVNQLLGGRLRVALCVEKLKESKNGE